MKKIIFAKELVCQRKGCNEVYNQSSHYSKYCSDRCKRIMKTIQAKNSFLKNKERNLQRRRDTRKIDPARFSEYGKKSYFKNIDKRIKYRKKYIIENKEIILAKDRIRGRKRREEIKNDPIKYKKYKEYQKKYRDKNM